MSEAKIDFSFENLHFSCEGDKSWVETQLNQILNRIPGLYKPVVAETSGKAKPFPVGDLIEGVPVDAEDNFEDGESKLKTKRGRKRKFSVTSEPIVDEPAGDPLLSFMKEKNADKNQVKKFLAATVFMHAQGEERFSTPMVSKLLKDAGIDKLINASDCLNKNEKKGFCIKDGKDFILTDEGIRSILGGK